LELCQFDNYHCLCQFCEDQCNNGLYCSDCEHAGETVHNVYLCTGFKGDYEKYKDNFRNKVVKEGRTEERKDGDGNG